MLSKLSLKASYDDVIRTAKFLGVGIEPEFITFVENQQATRRHWAAAENDADGAKSKMVHLETENKKLEAKCKHARNIFETEQQKRLKVEQDKDHLERQIALIRELLVDSKGNKLDLCDRERLAFLSNTTYGHKSHLEESMPRKRMSTIRDQSQHSILSDEDIDFWDKTEEDLDTPCGRPRRSKRLQKRPSAPPLEELNETPPKRYKAEETEVVTTTTITMTADGRPLEAIAEVSVPNEPRKTLNKSFSEPALDKHMTESEMDSDADPWTPQNKNKNYNNYNGGGLGGTPMTPSLRKAHSASRGLNRIHFFISETVIRPRTCVPCGKRIGFGRLAMKCKECKSMCHPECKESLPLPCIHAPPTPGTGKLQAGVLADFCRDEAPMIPGLVIHCVNEVESRGLQEVGIYRVPGSDRQVKELKEKFFKGKGMPNLSNIDDIHVICGCLKDFLRRLKEPLVTFKLWKNFVNAAENIDKVQSQSDMYHALSQLPQANRDTTAFLMLHLLRVSQTPECKMTSHNLSRVFGPTLVGHSRPDPEPSQLINETQSQAMVMDKLFLIPEDYWINFISDESENLYTTQGMNTPKTPEPSRILLESRLGPVHTPTSEKSKTWTTRTAHTPRFGDRTANISKKPSHFFSSPKLD